MKDRADKLRELFLSSGLRWLAERLRVRSSRGESLHEGILTKTPANEEERSAMDSLLGRKSTRAGKNLTVSLTSLSEMLCHAGLAEDLSEVVTSCFGEVANERALRDEIAVEWETVFRDCLESVSDDEIALEWIASLQSDGLLKRCSGGDPANARTFLDNAIEIWKRLPAEGVTLAELGGEMAGDTHALDRGRPLSTILLRGLKIRTGLDGTKNAESRRRVWNEVGVVIDRLSSPVLVFNLRVRSDTVLGKILALHEESSSPAYLSYQLLSKELQFEVKSNSKDIFVVENPSIVESAASLLGKNSHPLICTEGIPSSATKLLLQQLSEAGCRIHLRADFDWTGLRIVDHLLGIPNTRSWKMDAATYRRTPGTIPLAGRSFSSPWCTELSEAMAERGIASYEEQLTSELLSDLSRR